MRMDVLFVLNNLGRRLGEQGRTIGQCVSSTRGMRVGIAYLNEPTTLLKDIDSGRGARSSCRDEGRFSLKASAALETAHRRAAPTQCRVRESLSRAVCRHRHSLVHGIAREPSV